MIIVTVLATVLVTSAPDGSAMNTESTKRLPLQPEHRRAIEQIQSLGGDVRYEPDSQSQMLYAIVLRGKRFDDAQLPLFAPFRTHPPKSIAVVEAEVTDAFLAKIISQFPDLETLKVFRTPIGDAALQGLSKLRRLRNLELDGTNVTSDIGAQIGTLRRLESLSLTETRMDDQGLESWSALSNVTLLSLGKTQVTSAGMKSLAKLKALETLGLHGTQVGDAGVADLKTLRTLKVLRLDGTRVTDAGLAHLRELKSLKSIVLSRTAITDAGLRHLQDLPMLDRISLKNTKVTDKALDVFHLYLPANKERYRRFREEYEQTGKLPSRGG